MRIRPRELVSHSRRISERMTLETVIEKDRKYNNQRVCGLQYGDGG